MIPDFVTLNKRDRGARSLRKNTVFYFTVSTAAVEVTVLPEASFTMQR